MASSSTTRYMPSPQHGEPDDFVDHASHSIGHQPSEKPMLSVNCEAPSSNTSQQNLRTPQKESYNGGDGLQSSTRNLGFGHRFPLLTFAARYTAVVLLVTVILAIPIIATSRTVIHGNSGNYSQVLVYYLFLWLLTSWLVGCACNLFWRAFPYLFWWIASFVNPAHQKYWRVFRRLNLPMTLLGSMIFAWIAFVGVGLPR